MKIQKLLSPDIRVYSCSIVVKADSFLSNCWGFCYISAPEGGNVRTLSAALAAVILSAWGAQAGTGFVILNDTTILTTWSGDVQIGDYSSPALTNRPLVTMVAGGRITGRVDIYQGTLQMEGGQIDGNVYNYSFFNMNGGTLGPVSFVQNNYQFTLDGGTIPNEVIGNGLSSQIGIYSGSLNGLEVNNGTATVRTEVASYIRSTKGRTDIEYGGQTFQYYAEQLSTQHIRGALDSTVLIRAGNLAHVYFYGENLATNFVTNGVVIVNVTCNQYRITGTLQDGTDLRNVSYYLRNGDSPVVHLITTNVFRPSVAIDPTATTNVALSWPFPPLGWTLQRATNTADLSSTGAWKDVSIGTSQTGLFKYATVPATNDFSLYRLISK